MADKRECPICDYDAIDVLDALGAMFAGRPDPCRTCDPSNARVECNHRCRHGAHEAHTGECCYRRKVDGDER